MTDKHRKALLHSSVGYVEAKVVFRKAIIAAQRDGADERTIAHITGLTVPTIVAVLKTP